jgi:predicted MFS family arabinose efflux permease
MKVIAIKTSFLWAAVAIASAGLIFYNVMPMYLGQLQESTGLETTQIGLVASAFFFGFNIVSFSSYFWVRKVPVFQAAMFGTVLLIVTLILATRSNGFLFQIIVTTFIGGLSGAVGSLGVTIAGDAKNNTRWYGIQVAAEAAVGVVLLFLLPVTLIPAYGFAGVVYGMIILILVLLPAYFYLGRAPLSIPFSDTPSLDATNSDPSLHSLESQSSKPKLTVYLALVAMIFLFVGSAAVWAFVERIAAINEFDPESVGLLLGFALLFAVLGSLVTGAVGDRFGNIWPYIVNSLILIAGVILIAITDSLSIYTIGACLFMYGWAASFAYLFAIIADADPDGKHIALSVPAVGIGSMIGPGLTGFLLSEDSTFSLLIMCITTIAISIVCVLAGDRGEKS